MLKLVSYGEFPHPAGLQRVTRASAEALAADFNSLRGRLRRRFGGLPIYIGHPDDPGFQGKPGHTDTRAHGWVHQLEARPDGLYIEVKWGETGQALLANAHYKFLSPRWAMREVERGTWEPTRLLSVGLTNQPNIPGEAIANEARPAALLPEEHAPEARDDAPNGADDADAEPFDWEQAEATAEHFYRLAVDAQEAKAEADALLAELREELATERAARAELLLANAIHEGRLTTGEIAEWREAFANDFTASVERLDHLQAPLKTRPITVNLSPSVSATAASQPFLQAVHQRMAAHHEDFAAAWANVKRESPGLYAAMSA